MPVKINGSTSGSVTLAAPATGSDVTLTLPAATGTAATTANVTSAVAPMGLVAVAPTSIANSGGSASLSNYTVSFSGVSSVSLNGVFSGDYDNYRVLVTLTGAGADNNTVNFRLRSAGSDSSANYTVTGYQSFSGGLSNQSDISVNQFGPINTSTTTNAIVTMSADVFGPNASRYTAIHSLGLTHNATAVFVKSNTVSHAVASAYDGFTAYCAVTFTGTISVYGYKK